MKMTFEEPHAVEKAKTFLNTLRETYVHAMRSRREITNKIKQQKAIEKERAKNTVLKKKILDEQ